MWCISEFVFIHHLLFFFFFPQPPSKKNNPSIKLGAGEPSIEIKSKGGPLIVLWCKSGEKDPGLTIRSWQTEISTGIMKYQENNKQ